LFSIFTACEHVLGHVPAGVTKADERDGVVVPRPRRCPRVRPSVRDRRVSLSHTVVRHRLRQDGSTSVTDGVRTTVVGSWWSPVEVEDELRGCHRGELTVEQGEAVLNRAAALAIDQQRGLG
jgi:hypothetical protein